LSASIGIALYPGDAGSAEDLMRLSDPAMYAVKEGGATSSAALARPDGAVILPNLIQIKFFSTARQYPAKPDSRKRWRWEIWYPR
jgi:GGDEF domain-containing protein